MICVIRPEDDPAAERFSVWWDLVAPSCPRGVRVKHLGRSTTRTEVEVALPDASLVLYFGHGTEEDLCRFDRQRVFVDRHNVALAAKKIIVAIACSSAQTLGEYAASAGVEAYLGFTSELFSVPIFHELFGKAVVSGIALLLLGGSIEMASDATRDALHQLAVHFDDPHHPDGLHRDSGWAVCCAWSNFDAIQSKGNPAATVIW